MGRLGACVDKVLPKGQENCGGVKYSTVAPLTTKCERHNLYILDISSLLMIVISYSFVKIRNYCKSFKIF